MTYKFPKHTTFSCDMIPIRWPENPKDGETFAYLCPFSGQDWIFWEWKDDLFGWHYMGKY